MIWLIVIPVAVVAAAVVLTVAYLRLGRDGGMHAAPREPLPARVIAAPRRRQLIARTATAGQPPAEITDLPVAEPDTAGFPAIRT